MSKCKRCDEDTLTSAKICPTCLDNWTHMRTEVLNILGEKHGKLSPDNHELFIKETKRLESVWKKDKNRFAWLILNYNKNDKL